MNKRVILWMLIVALIDQLVKYWVEWSMQVQEAIVLIPDLFSILFVKNDGAAFSMFSGNRLFLITIGIFSLVLIFYLCSHEQKNNKWDQTLYGILCGGILGNVIDRIFRGYVVDYFSFELPFYHFPIFNIADVAIVISGVVVAMMLIFGGKHEGNQSRSTRRAGAH